MGVFDLKNKAAILSYDLQEVKYSMVKKIPKYRLKEAYLELDF